MADKTAKTAAASQIWGGRFAHAPAALMREINASISVDKRLWRQDIDGSKAHCAMLAAQNIIPAAAAAEIAAGLETIAAEIESGQFPFRQDLEDIHMNIEARLKELIGESAGMLHTARSRNDQVATDFRLWVREACDTVIEHIEAYQAVLGALSAAHDNSVIPGFTHLQVAQPISLAMHLHAYRQMAERDKSRFADCRARLNESPLGACALSGTGFPIDRAMTAKALGFAGVMENTLDAVAARDFAAEFLFACAQCGLHLSRLAEEIILWATPQFGFLTLSDAWTSGSSIMPQKKNPDAAELVRAKTGRLNGNLIQLMTLMKALPLAYNKDMQEDKEAVFSSFDTLCLCLQAMGGMLETAEFNLSAMREAAELGYATATEIADWLVRNLQLPFREAHHITGALVKLAETRQCRLSDLPLSEMQKIEPRLNADIYAALNIDAALQSRRK